MRSRGPQALNDRHPDRRHRDLCATPAVVVLMLGWLVALAFAPSARAERLQDLKPQGYVNDFAGVLDANTRTQLTEVCTEVDEKAQAQIAVVTIHTLDGAPIEDFANKLYERWGIGPKSNNRGVLILLATEDHRYRVEVGYGLEPILPDGKVGGFGRQMIPRLRAGDYSGGVLGLTGEIAQVIARDRGVTLSSKLPAPPSQDESGGGSGNGGILIALLVLGFVLLSGLKAFSGGVVGSRRRRYGLWGMGPWMGGPFMRGGGFGGFGGGGGGGGFGGFGGGISGGGGASGGW